MDDRSAARFLGQVVGFVVLTLVSLSLYIETQPMAFSDRAYALWSYPLDYVRSGPAARASARVLVLGDSRAQAALIPEAIGKDVVSLALMSSTPIDARFLLRDYLATRRAPEWVVLSFAPYHLQRDNERFFWGHSVKYAAHGFGDFLEVLGRSEAVGEPLLGDAGHLRTVLEWWLYRLRFPPYYLAELKASSFAFRRADNLAARREVERERGHYAFGHAPASHGIAKEAQFDRFEPSPLLDRYLQDAIAMAVDAGSRVVVRSMPLNESSFHALAPRYVSDYAAYMMHLGERFPQIESDPELSCLPDDHFGDGSHVNDRGARRLSAALRIELETREAHLAQRGTPAR